MNRMKGIPGYFVLCFAFVFMWSRPASAGVPAPAPGPDARPEASEVQIANLGDFQFASGEVVKDFRVSYVTHGKLTEKKDNVILVMHHGLGDYRQLGFLIGPGKALDTDKYFIVATDALGNVNARHLITTGPTNSGLKMNFPRYSIRDMVNVDYRLLKEHLGFDHILAAVGASTGGMKAYQFGASYPAYCKGLIPIAGTPVSNAQIKATVKSWMQIFELDSGWYGGNYETNPMMAYHTWEWTLLPWAFTPQFFAEKLKTAEAYHAWEQKWSGYLRQTPRDARDIYYWLQAWGDNNIGDTPGFNGDAKAALESIQARVLIIGNKGDMLVTREGSVFAENSIPHAKYVEIDTPWGHMTCVGMDHEGTEIMHREIKEFLKGLSVAAD